MVKQKNIKKTSKIITKNYPEYLKHFNLFTFYMKIDITWFIMEQNMYVCLSGANFKIFILDLII